MLGSHIYYINLPKYDRLHDQPIQGSQLKRED